MRKYELVTLLAPALSPDGVKAEVGKIEDIIKERGGETVEVQNWGKREVEFIMNKSKFAHYVNICFQTGDGDTVDALRSVLRINDNVLKFQTHRTSEKKRKFQGNPLGSKRNRDGEIGSDLDDDFDDI